MLHVWSKDQYKSHNMCDPKININHVTHVIQRSILIMLHVWSKEMYAQIHYIVISGYMLHVWFQEIYASINIIIPASSKHWNSQSEKYESHYMCDP